MLLTGCGQQQPKPQRLNTDQAQALAIMRFNNYSARHLNTTISATTGTVKFKARAIIDTRRGAGYAEYTASDPTSGNVINKGMLAWNNSLVETAEGGDFTHPPAAKGWTERSLTSASTTDILLVLALELSADRPENPALLQQGGARLLRTEGSGSKTTYVIAGPGSSAADTGGGSASPSASTGSKTTYWVDKTGHLSKFVADLGGSPATITVTGATGYPTAIPKVIYRYLRMKG